VVDASVLTAPAVTSSSELAQRLADIQAVLPDGDGLVWFNRMYQLVASSVGGNLGTSALTDPAWTRQLDVAFRGQDLDAVRSMVQAPSAFADPAWIRQLDIAFGNLYLDALRTSVQTPDQVPRSWAALLERRTAPGIAPLQFALAGMNAHINRDLPVALLKTCAQSGTSLDAGSHHADFVQVNTVLAKVEPAIRELVEGEPLAEADRTFPGLLDVIGNFSLVKARDTAWVNGETLWVLDQHAPAGGAAYLDALDHLAGFAGRGLLVRLAR
jgi:hypothetical protein